MKSARFLSAALLFLSLDAAAESEFRFEADSLQIDDDSGRMVATGFRAPLVDGSTLEAATATFDTTKPGILREVALQGMKITAQNGVTLSAEDAVYYPDEQKFAADRVTVDEPEIGDTDGARPTIESPDA